MVGWAESARVERVIWCRYEELSRTQLDMAAACGEVWLGRFRPTARRALSRVAAAVAAR